MGTKKSYDMRKGFLWTAVICLATCLQSEKINANERLWGFDNNSLNKALSGTTSTIVNNFEEMTINSDQSQKRVVNFGKILLTGNGKIGGVAGGGVALTNGGMNPNTGNVAPGTVEIAKETIIPTNELGGEIENITSIENISGKIVQYGGYVGRVHNNGEYIYAGGKLRSFDQKDPSASVRITNGMELSLKDGFPIMNGVVTVGGKDENGNPLTNGILSVNGNMGDFHLVIGENFATLNLLGSTYNPNIWQGSILKIESGVAVIDGQYAKWEGDVHLTGGTLKLINVISKDNKHPEGTKTGSLIAFGGRLEIYDNVYLTDNDYIAETVEVVKNG